MLALIAIDVAELVISQVKHVKTLAKTPSTVWGTTTIYPRCCAPRGRS
jgi:hypothetical protein